METVDIKVLKESILSSLKAGGNEDWKIEISKKNHWLKAVCKKGNQYLDINYPWKEWKDQESLFESLSLFINYRIEHFHDAFKVIP